MFRTNSKYLEIDEALDFIKVHQGKQKRYSKLQAYYEGDHDILKTGAAARKRKNKIVHPFPKYITDFSSGYFMGNAVKYVSTFEGDTTDDEFLEEYQSICNYNNEAKENLALAKANSIKGESYEILWIDNNSKVRFKRIQPDNVFLVYDMSIDEVEQFGVRYYLDNKNGRVVTYVEIYDNEIIAYYNNEKDPNKFDLTELKEHPFGLVPIIHFKNNEELQGDFEQVISIIDAYNREQSNTLNDMDEFSDAYLALIGYNDSDPEDIEKMKEDKVLLLDNDGDAKWLIKDVNDTWVENAKNRLNKDAHKFSFTPDFTDEAFGTNLPGVSLRLKLLTSEELRATKELFFREGLIKRMDLIANYLSIKTNRDIIRNDISMQFSDALPQNILEISNIIQNLSPDVSTETRLSLLPFVENPADEMEKKAKEDEEKVEQDLIMYKNFAKDDINGEDEEKAILGKEKRG